MDRALKLAAALALLAVAAPARGALGPKHGGTITLPAPEPVTSLDPARAETSFEATLTEALFDRLYEVREDGTVEAVLAAGPPEIEQSVARIRLRRGALHHGTRPIRARHVVRSLQRTSSSPLASWLLGAFATENGRPAIREVDEHTIEIGLARRGLRVDIVLAAAPLAIVVGGNVRGRPLGTGPFRGRLDGRGGVEMRIFRRAPDRPPWVNRVRFTPPRPREEEVRAFELGRLDGSWWSRSLYGGQPVRPVETATGTAAAPVLLVPNRARALRDDDAWGGVAGAIDRRRLERVGRVARRSLGPGLPSPSVPRGRAPRGARLRMLVREDRPFERRIAEALAGMLDERGVTLQVERLSADRLVAVVARGDWDLRLAMVRPPLPGRGPLVGAALAAAGQTDRARTLATQLGDASVAAEAARQLDVLVLGHERLLLHHRADLRGIGFDGQGRLTLADASFARAPVAAPTGSGEAP